MKKLKLLFITDIHQNEKALSSIDFNDFAGVICGGDIIDPANCDISKSFRLLGMLPALTYIVPGNCDTDTGLFHKICEMDNCIEKRIIATKWGFNIAGIGKARDLRCDLEVYRDYFKSDKKRIEKFLDAGGPEFILKFSGITKDGLVVDNSEVIRDNAPFFNKFISFSEDEVANLYGRNSLENGILVTHSPAFGHMDSLPGLPHIGSKGVANLINIAKPSLVLSGHFHELPGYEVVDGVTYFNPGALKDNRYGVIEVIDGKFNCYVKNI